MPKRNAGMPGFNRQRCQLMCLQSLGARETEEHQVLP